MGGTRLKTKVKGLWITGKGQYVTKLWNQGRSHWVSLGGDVAEAKKKLHRFKGGEPAPSRVTLQDAVDEWLQYIEVRRPSPQGLSVAKARAEQYLLKHFPGGGKLGLVSQEAISRYRQWLDKQGLAPRTVMHILSDLRSLLRWCERTGRVSRSTFVSSMVMPKLPEAAPKGLSPSEIEAVCSLPGDMGWTWRFLIGSALRWGEATRARADHVSADGMLMVEKCKGKRIRRVPLSQEVLTEIRSRVGLLVPYVASNNFARSTFRQTGLGGVNVHRARHTYAMRWIASGGSIVALQEILGHRELKTTQIYARVTDDYVRSEASRVYAEQRQAG